MPRLRVFMKLAMKIADAMTIKCLYVRTGCKRVKELVAEHVCGCASCHRRLQIVNDLANWYNVRCCKRFVRPSYVGRFSIPRVIGNKIWAKEGSLPMTQYWLARVSMLIFWLLSITRGYSGMNRSFLSKKASLPRVQGTLKWTPVLRGGSRNASGSIWKNLTTSSQS